jgi:DNA-binding Lrp family transcriptional regulator
MDRANEDVCGPAIVHLLERAYSVYGDARYGRLATLSVSHLYNLRKSAGYQAQRVRFTKTRPVCNPIGVRRAPRPQGRAGFVRIDTVHQGDLDGIKGVYHITCVDAVSQWQVQACVQGISEAFLLPVLMLVMAQFPFEIEGFHSDNGSEYVNGKVALMLEKLRIEQTKSRSRHSNDNALAESKNASVVRKHMGYSHIPQKYAQPINAFYQKTFNPWLNLHRPCLFATKIKTNPPGSSQRPSAESVRLPFSTPQPTSPRHPLRCSFRLIPELENTDGTGERPATSGAVRRQAFVAPTAARRVRAPAGHALQEGLPLFMRPFSVLASRVGCEESEVLERIRRWCAEGIIKRFGVVVRHHELGYTANAMLVHDIPDEAMSPRSARNLAREPGVTSAISVRGCLPDWPYNLFCMIHGQVRAEVEASIAELRARLRLEDCAHDVLFSLTRFKQGGARYA